jgi:hypothetical protein
MPEKRHFLLERPWSGTHAVQPPLLQAHERLSFRSLLFLLRFAAFVGWKLLEFQALLTLV